MEAEKAKAAADRSSESRGSPDSSRPQHSPRSVLEEMSLQQSMDRNKESLKRKLMMRRSVNELVDQGIYPPLKTPPLYAEQRKHLERAKTGDILRHKIEHRPDRNFLVQQHILEDTNIDRSLHERQRLLKRARLADNLNDKLLHRPGPLELLKGNILQSENNTFVSAIKDGVITFNNTCSDDESDSAVNLGEDDSNHSDVALSPPQFDDSTFADIGSPPIPTTPDLSKIFQNPILKHSQVQTGNIATKIAPITAQTFSTGNLKNGSYSNGKVRPKKQKPKTQSKAKVIKFHEYKGPPNIVKTAPPVLVPQPDTETPYNILLQQQQMFLQWQVKFQQDNLNLPLLLPAQTVEVDGQSSPSQSSGGIIIAPTVSAASGSPPPPGTMIIQAQGSVPQSIIGSPQPAVLQQSLAPTIVQQQSPQLLAQPQPQISIPQAFTPTPVAINSPPLSAPVLSPPALVSVMSPSTPTPILSPPSPVRAPTPQHIIQPPPTPIIQTQTVFPVAQPQIHLPTSKVSTHSKFHSRNNKHSNHSSVITSVNTPLSNLEDMKVQALKAELKKRNLPVSGTKTHLIERLRPYEDVITVSAPGSVNTNENPVAPVQAIKTIVTVKPMVQDKKCNIISTPPLSPAHVHLMNPISPEIIDMASPPNVTVGLTLKKALSQNSIPVVTDQSRPPSAEIDTSMDVESSLADMNNSVNSSPASIQAPASPQSAPQTPSPTVVSQFVSQDELLVQHQKKIEMLQKQLELEESQFRLQLLQLQHQQLQQQQHQLKQQQQELQDIQKESTSQSNSSSQIVNTFQLTMPEEGQISSSIGSNQIQIPTHILQPADQNTQGIPVIVQTAPLDVSKQTKPSLVDFFKAQPLQQNVNTLGQPNVSLATAPAGIHPFIITSTLGKAAPVTQLNGIIQNRTASLPGSPVEVPQGLTRTVSNPFFTIPLKAPPEYDEAIKSKHQHHQNGGLLAPMPLVANSSSKNTATKSHTMDDVLEILIRNGELPPSAWVQDPLSTPKTTSQTKNMSSVSVPSSNHMPFDNMANTSMSGFLNFSSFTFPSATTATNTFTTSVIQESMPSTAQMLAQNIKLEPASPPPITISVVDRSSSELLGLSDVLDQDMDTMDWTSDPSFTSMELTDTPGMVSALDMRIGTLDDKTLLSIPTSGAGSCSNNRGSEPDLTALGLSDTDAPINMQIDISDWLDVHLPSTGLTPLSANAPVSFPSDPILTPKTQQEVLDLFNFDDADFSTPTDLQSGINWDKITETATSSS